MVNYSANSRVRILDQHIVNAGFGCAHTLSDHQRRGSFALQRADHFHISSAQLAVTSFLGFAHGRFVNEGAK